MTKAAEKIHLTQPALSGAINKLEGDLGVKLFDRIGRNKIMLNQYGQILLRGVQAAFHGLNDAMDEMQDLQATGSGLIRFATPSDGILMDLIEQFLMEHPGVHMIQKFTYGSSAAEDLKKRELDFVISYGPLPDSDLNWYPLFDFQLAVLASESHPFARRDSLRLSDLSGVRLALFVLSDEFPAAFCRLCSVVGIVPRIIYQGGTPVIVGRMLASGDCISVVPAGGDFLSADQTNRVSKYLYADGIKEIPLEGEDCCLTLGYSTLKNHYLPGSARELLERIRRSPSLVQPAGGQDEADK